MEYYNANIFNYMDFRYVLILCDFLHIKTHWPEATRNSIVVKYVFYLLLTSVKEIHSMGIMDMPESDIKVLLQDFGFCLLIWEKV